MPNATVHIVTDSTCDLDPAVLRAHQVHMVPLEVRFGAETYRDWLEMPPPVFYDRLAAGGPHPTTSQPSPQAFQETYQRLLSLGGTVISLHLSAQMSGTMQSALLARQQVDSARVHVIDSRFTSVALGAIVLECARAAQAGRAVDEILEIARRMSETTSLIFVVDSLDYLQKGGRIGRAAALFGSLLNIKPILGMRDGLVYAMEKHRGTKKVQARFIELVGEWAAAHRGCPIRAAITWAKDPGPIEAMIPGLSTHLDLRHALRSEIGAVVGTHVGPGTIGIALSCPPA
jgi:DegV family protein with EDD domain